jgi:hypothetical protein
VRSRAGSPVRACKPELNASPIRATRMAISDLSGAGGQLLRTPRTGLQGRAIRAFAFICVSDGNTRCAGCPEHPTEGRAQGWNALRVGVYGCKGKHEDEDSGLR